MSYLGAMNRPGTIFVGISGGTCSGKTTLAARLKTILGDRCAVLAVDSYYKTLDMPFAERAKLNHDLPETIDWPLLRSHIRALLEGRPVDSPVYSYRRHNRTDAVLSVAPAPLLLLEGIHAWHDPEIRAAMSFRVFLDSTRDARRERRLARDLQERCPDIDYVLRKFEEQTERTFALFGDDYRRQADMVTDDPVAAEGRILELMRSASPLRDC
jgi:uridine kinase